MPTGHHRHSWASAGACAGIAAGTAEGASPGHPRHRPALAPPPGRQEVDLAAPDRTAASQRRDRRAHRAARHREPRLCGYQRIPRRAAQARLPGRRIHHPPCPQGAEDPSGTGTAYRHDLAEVPAQSGVDDARHRFLPRGLRGHSPAPVLPVCVVETGSRASRSRPVERRVSSRLWGVAECRPDGDTELLGQGQTMTNWAAQFAPPSRCWSWQGITSE